MPVPSLDPEFADMMTQRVTVAAWTGQNAYGARTYGTARTYPCHLTQDPAVFENQQGQDIGTEAIVWMSPVADDGTFIYTDLAAAQAGFAEPPPLGNILNGSQFTLPDGTVPPVRTAAILQDDVGWHHVKVIF